MVMVSAYRLEERGFLLAEAFFTSFNDRYIDGGFVPFFNQSVLLNSVFKVWIVESGLSSHPDLSVFLIYNNANVICRFLFKPIRAERVFSSLVWHLLNCFCRAFCYRAQLCFSLESELDWMAESETESERERFEKRRPFYDYSFKAQQVKCESAFHTGPMAHTPKTHPTGARRIDTPSPNKFKSFFSALLPTQLSS